MLLVDQMEAAGGTVAEHLGLPFTTVCNAQALNREPDVPPPFSPRSYRPVGWATARKRLGYAVSDWLNRPIAGIIERRRKAWKLLPHQCLRIRFHARADRATAAPVRFPRRRLPSTFASRGSVAKGIRAGSWISRGSGWTGVR